MQGPIEDLKGKRVKIKSKLSGKALDICQEDGHGNRKGDLIVYDYYGGDNQKFQVVQDGHDVTLKNQASDRVLQVENESHENGAQVVAGVGKNRSNQKWRFQQSDAFKNEYYIYCCHSGKVLDLCEGKESNNTKVIQWEFHGRDNQLWIVKEV